MGFSFFFPRPCGRSCFLPHGVQLSAARKKFEARNDRRQEYKNTGTQECKKEGGKEGRKKVVEKTDGSQYNPSPYARKPEGPSCLYR